MEVASPLSFAAPTPSNKRQLTSCSPTNNPLMEGLAAASPGSSSFDRENQGPAKRRRFHHDMSVDSLSNAFSSHSPFFSGGSSMGKLVTSSGGYVNSINTKRPRSSSPSNGSAALDELNKVVEEQKAVIKSLKSDKTQLTLNMDILQKDHDRLAKENQLLRRAVHIQEDRKSRAESNMQAAQGGQQAAQDQVRKLEQLVLSLRYHLAQQSRNNDNFMTPRPPDVF